LPHHGEVDVAGIELHVDLLVEECLRLLMEVHTDPAGRHLEPQLDVNGGRLVSSVQSYVVRSCEV
jgi:hypothetical protein